MIFYESDRERQGRGLYYAARRQDLGCGLHLHDSFELTVVTEGELIATVDKDTRSLRAGEAVLVFPGQIHGYKTPASSQSGVFVFPASLVGEYYEAVRKKQPNVSFFSLPVADICAQLWNAGENRWRLKALLYDVIDRFDRGVTYLPRHAAGCAAVERILAIVAERYAEPLTLCVVAAELGYDHRYLSNLLQRNLHTTFRRLLNEHRISCAQRILLRTNSPVEQIAGECGYDSLCSFNRNFKSITGTTPTLWRTAKKT